MSARAKRRAVEQASIDLFFRLVAQQRATDSPTTLPARAPRRRRALVMDREFVLIVQADANLRKDATEQLQESGIRAVAVASAEQALSVLRRACAAAVVLDTQLPMMTARALRETMLGEPSMATIPVIVTTPALRVPRSFRPATVLRRPFAVAALQATVQAALSAAKTRL